MIDFFKNKIKEQLPKNIKEIVEKFKDTKNENERMEYLKTLPEETLKRLASTSTYVLLKLEEKKKGSALKENTEHEGIKTIQEVKKTIIQNGENVTKENVRKTTEKMWGTAAIGGLISSIVLFIQFTISILEESSPFGSLFFMILQDLTIDFTDFAAKKHVEEKYKMEE